MPRRSHDFYSPKDTKHCNSTDVWICWGPDNVQTGTRLLLGTLPNEEVHSYLDTLNSFVPQRGACMQYHFYFVLHSHPFKAHNKMWLKQALYIVVANPYPENVKYLCGATNGKECLGNIKCRKCIDPFVRECAMKKFLALKCKTER